jgi:hypothetical protein
MIVTLLDGRTVDSSELVFHPDTYHVFFNGEDVTNNMRQYDKRQIWPDFDQSVDNERAYAERYFREHGTQPPPTGSSSTFVNFWQQIATDPLAAPLETLDATTSKLWENKTVKTVIIIAGIGVALYALSLLLKVKAAATP